MTFAGLGLRLHDITYGTDLHQVFGSWWEYARAQHVPISDGRMSDAMSMYYDPIIDLHHKTPSQGPAKLFLVPGLLPQFADDSRIVFESALDDIGWAGADGPDETSGHPGLIGIGKFWAREEGDGALQAKLTAYAEDHHEPTWDEETGEFTWGFGLNEPHPRGQFNASAAMAEATTEGAWKRLFNQPNLRKFVDPTVFGVDFPTVCLSQATYDAERRLLVIATDAGVPAARGKPTTFRVTNIDPGSCSVVVDGQASDDWRAVDGDLEVATDVGPHTFLIRQRG
jgi:hypothetical protein